MKQTDKFAVLRNKETGNFLSDFESKEGTFAYSASFTSDLRYAAKNELNAIEDQKEGFEKLANAFDSEILVIEAEYTFKTLDGDEPKDFVEEIEEAKREHIKNILRALLSEDEDEEE